MKAILLIILFWLATISAQDFWLEKSEDVVKSHEISGSAIEIGKAFNWVTLKYYDSTKVDYRKLLNAALIGLATSSGRFRALELIDESDSAIALNIFYSQFKVLAQNSDLPVKELTKKAIRYGLRSLNDSHTYLFSKIVRDSSKTKAMIVNSDGLNYLYCRIESFRDVKLIENDIMDSLRLAQQVDAVVIDCRGNPGGYQRLVEKIVEYFMPEGTVLWTTWRNGRIREKVDNSSHEMSLPVIVLVNKYSGSGSEVLAAIFKNQYPNALIIGEKTSGAANIAHKVYLNKFSIMVTTYQLRIAGQLLEGVGVEPDIVVVNTDSTDSQLLRAVEELRKIVNKNRITKIPVE